MNLLYKNTISAKDYNWLREMVGWGELCEEQAQQGLDHSTFIIGCYDGTKAVGSARLIWDHGYVAYLADVMIHPEYQRMGIGTYMVNEIITYMKSQLKSGWIVKMVLISAKGKETFYEKLGFSARPNDTAGPGMDRWIVPN